MLAWYWRKNTVLELAPLFPVWFPKRASAGPGWGNWSEVNRRLAFKLPLIAFIALLHSDWIQIFKPVPHKPGSDL